MSPDSMYERVLDLQPGRSVEYHRGSLIHDREAWCPAPHHSGEGKSAVPRWRGYRPGPIATTADLMLILAGKKAVHLLQVRHGPGDYSYLAIRR